MIFVNGVGVYFEGLPEPAECKLSLGLFCRFGDEPCFGGAPVPAPGPGALEWKEHADMARATKQSATSNEPNEHMDYPPLENCFSSAGSESSTLQKISTMRGSNCLPAYRFSS